MVVTDPVLPVAGLVVVDVEVGVGAELSDDVVVGTDPVVVVRSVDGSVDGTAMVEVVRRTVTVVCWGTTETEGSDERGAGRMRM